MLGYLLFLSTLPHRVDRREANTKQVNSSSCFPAYRMSGTRGTGYACFVVSIYPASHKNRITDPNPVSNLELNEKSYFDQIKVILVGRNSS